MSIIRSHTPQGPTAPAPVFVLRNDAGLRLTFMEQGATWLSCSLVLADGSRREVLLGCRDQAEYRRQRLYVGAVIGRFSNRIRNSCFELDGQLQQLSPNEGPHHLHGGPEGFDRKDWRVLRYDERELVFGLVSPHGDQGYPGEVTARVCYRIGEDLSLAISMSARSTAPCPVGLSQHAYFNLDGDRGGDTASCLGQRLRVAADHWLPIDADKLPAADLQSVLGRGFDLREGATLAQAIEADPTLRAEGGFDHCLALRPGLAMSQEGESAAELWSTDGQVSMQLRTDQAALQVYTGQDLFEVMARDGRHYPAHAGIALEPQFVPDSMNSAFDTALRPDCILRPGQVWHSCSRMNFALHPAASDSRDVTKSQTTLRSVNGSAPGLRAFRALGEAARYWITTKTWRPAL